MSAPLRCAQSDYMVVSKLTTSCKSHLYADAHHPYRVHRIKTLRDQEIDELEELHLFESRNSLSADLREFMKPDPYYDQYYGASGSYSDPTSKEKRVAYYFPPEKICMDDYGCQWEWF